MKPATTAVYRETVRKLCAAERASVVVEIGVYAGGLSKLLATVPSVSRLVLVDPWADFLRFSPAHMEGVARDVTQWAKTTGGKVEVLRMPSVKAADLFDDESVDFVHTDGDHRTPLVIADIESWMPKLKPGRLFTGDNYEAPHVAAGVDALLPDRTLEANGRVWVYRK